MHQQPPTPPCLENNLSKSGQVLGLNSLAVYLGSRDNERRDIELARGGECILCRQAAGSSIATPIEVRAVLSSLRRANPVIASLVSNGSSYNPNPTSAARIYASALRDPYQRAGENSSLLRATFQLENCQGPDGTNGLLAHISQGCR